MVQTVKCQIIYNSVYGTVYGEERNILKNATVKLTMQSDTVKSKTVLTNSEGYFIFSALVEGKYLCTFSFTGYETTTKEIEITRQNYNMGAVYLKRRHIQLADVSVTASKVFIDAKPGITIYHVAADPLAFGKSVADLATFLPGVSQNGSGNLTIDGESQLMILINGRKSNISAAELIRQIPAANIERLELITGADPRFVSVAGAAVLNVVLKKNKQKGFNGNSSLQVNNYGFTNASINLNNYAGKTNMYLFISSDDKFQRNSSSYFRSSKPTNNIFFSGNFNNDLHHSMRVITAGTDIYIDSMRIITLEHSVSLHSDAMKSTSSQTRFGTGTNVFSQTDLQTRPLETEHQSSVNYRRNYKDPRKYFEAEVSTTFFSLNNERVFSKSTPFEKLQLSNHAIRARAEFVTNLGKTSLLSTGFDYASIGMQNRLEQLMSASNKIEETSLSNTKIAILSSLTFKTGTKLTFKPGLRLEQGHIEIQDQSKERTLFDLIALYPTLNVLWEPTKKTAVSFDLLRKLNYPDLFEFYTSPNQPDTFNLYQGNPYLVPAIRYNGSVELRHKAKRVNWNLRIYGRIITNIMRQAYNYGNDDVITTFTENIGTLNAFGGSVTSVFNVNKVWNIRVIANGGFSKLRLSKNIYTNTTNLYDISASYINRFQLNKKSDAEISLRVFNIFRGANEKSDLPMFNFSVQYNLRLKNSKWVLNFLANDILFTMKSSYTSYPSPFIEHSQQFIQRSRYIQAALRYKFGGNGKTRAKLSNEERIQFGNG
jgi:hypothetical protein